MIAIRRTVTSTPESHAATTSCVLLALIAALAINAPATAQIVAGEHIPIEMDTPSDYSGVVDQPWKLEWHDVIHHPGATYISIHFSDFDLAEGDYVVVSDLQDQQRYVIGSDGKLGHDVFWAQHIKGDAALIQLFVTSDSGGSGFVIDEYVAGNVDLGRRDDETEVDPGLSQPEAICGLDDKENAICYQLSHPTEYAKGRAVARLLISGSRLCTGWLVSSNNLLLTNEHCISTNSDALNTDYEFAAEAPNCPDYNCQLCHPGVIFSGGTLLKDSSNLDYALIEVTSGDPASTYGHLDIDDRVAVVGEEIYIPQHPGGRAKELAVVSTDPRDPGGIPRVYSITTPACSGAGYFDVGYFADTEGGSSGSPVLARSSHKVIALHHCAYCPNRGVPSHLVYDEIRDFLQGSRGTVALDRATYSCNDTATVTVADTDLAGTGVIQVEVETAGGDLELLNLTETSPNSARFEGSISLNTGTVVQADGVVQVSHGDLISAIYEDADDGTGNPATVVDTADVDCTPPISATLIDFEDIAVPPGTNDIGGDRVSYGYIFDSDSNHSHRVNAPGWAPDNGGTYLVFDDYRGESWTLMAPEDGTSLFSLGFVDLTRANGSYTATTVRFDGSIFGGGTISQTFTLGAGFQTFTFDPGWNSLTSVRFKGLGNPSDNYFGIDNINIASSTVLELEPELAFNAVGEEHTLTGTLMRGLGPVPDVEVTFEVFAGPNAGDGGTDTTDINGEATFAYIGDGGAGVDKIEAWAIDDVGGTVESNVALKFWDEDCQDPPNGIPDTCDIDCDGFDGFCSKFAGCGGSADNDGNGIPDECVLPPVVSYGVEGGLPHIATLNGTPVRPVDAVNVFTGELVFAAFPDTILEDIDAFHVNPDGSVVFSTSTDVTQGFGGIPNIKNGDLVLWDGSEATLLFSELIGFGSSHNDIDAFSVLPNGNWLLSTVLPAFLGGLSFQNGDIVEYDPVADVATLYMGLDEATIFTGTPQSNADIDALEVDEDENVIFSIRSNGIGRIGNDLSYGWPDAASTDLFVLDPVSGHAELYLDGFGLFDGMTRNLDAVSLGALDAIPVPEPGRLLLLGFGIAGLLVIGRRRIRA